MAIVGISLAFAYAHTFELVCLDVEQILIPVSKMWPFGEKISYLCGHKPFESSLRLICTFQTLDTLDFYYHVVGKMSGCIVTNVVYEGMILSILQKMVYTQHYQIHCFSMDVSQLQIYHYHARVCIY